jgi:hypothetical protein
MYSKAEADCEVERVDVADILAGCIRVKYGVMCSSRFVENRRFFHSLLQFDVDLVR